MPLKFNFERFHQIKDTDRCTIPGFEKFSDGNNPFIRRQTLVEVTPGVYTRMDIIVDPYGVWLMLDGMIEKQSEYHSEGSVLNLLRDMDKYDVISLDFLNTNHFEV